MLGPEPSPPGRVCATGRVRHRYAAPALGNMSFEVGTFAAFELAVPAAGNVSGAKAFNGVVGVDGAGAVV